MSLVGEKERRLEWVTRARDYADKALESIGNNATASATEKSLAVGTVSFLRDWSRRLQGELGQSAFRSRDFGVSGTHECLVRLGAKLDKVEALFEKVIEQEAARAASRDRFEQATLAQLGPLKDAVLLLLHRDPPSVADKMEAAGRIQRSTDNRSLQTEQKR